MMFSPKLLILDNALDHQIYQPVEHWSRALGFGPDHIHVPSGEPLPVAGTHTHVILTGSEASILKRASWVDDEMRWVQEAIKQEVRILGSCWGHQLIAFAQGGPNCVRRSNRPEIGWFPVEVLNPDGLLPPGSVSTFLFHFDEVIPGSHPDMKILARSAACAVQACRWGALPVWGIQAHPEIYPEAARWLLQNASVSSPDQKEIYQEVLLTPANDSYSIKEIIKNFLDK
jgi:GMP synthase-like glutamine amidotransferase